jgi:endonuclease/exonuclease/phosphatase family metal-dependent hydrolase
MFEEAGYKNLIKEFNIKNTRNNTCWEQFKEDVKISGKQHFADYCFTSHDVKVKSFEVPYNEVSDHLPLILDIDI